MTTEETEPKIVVRTAKLGDIQGIQRLGRKTYPTMGTFTTAQLRGHMQNFPEGQFVIVFEDEIVGYCCTFRISDAIAFRQHTWEQITGNGYASRHDPSGEWLYGFDVFIDPDHQGQRLGQRLYNERKSLCQAQGLKGIVFGGRLPGLAEAIKEYATPEAYLDAVKNNHTSDPVAGFHIRNGFEPIGLLRNYLPMDKESLGHAAHMVWPNPAFSEETLTGQGYRQRRGSDVIRVSIVQYQQRRVKSFEEFGHNIEYFVDVVADYRADFVVFPELFTLQLLSVENEEIPASQAIAKLTQYTEQLKELLSDLAVRYNINIIGGSHPTEEDGKILNICYVCLRDGSIHAQPKIHPTPNERYWWGIQGGDALNTIMTDCGPIGVLICYDSEFPELPRHLVDQGAQLLFVPFCTDERQSYLRVRYCNQARAVENQCYVALAGNVGNLPNVDNMDIQYAQSCILTPCDFPFARDGVAADTTPNAEMVAFADLRLEDLRRARTNGTVQNLKDRRFDLYSVAWKGPE